MFRLRQQHGDLRLEICAGGKWLHVTTDWGWFSQGEGIELQPGEVRSIPDAMGRSAIVDLIAMLSFDEKRISDQRAQLIRVLVCAHLERSQRVGKQSEAKRLDLKTA